MQKFWDFSFFFYGIESRRRVKFLALEIFERWVKTKWSIYTEINSDERLMCGEFEKAGLKS